MYPSWHGARFGTLHALVARAPQRALLAGCSLDENFPAKEGGRERRKKKEESWRLSFFSFPGSFALRHQSTREPLAFRTFSRSPVSEKRRPREEEEGTATVCAKKSCANLNRALSFTCQSRRNGSEATVGSRRVRKLIVYAYKLSLVMHSVRK